MRRKTLYAFFEGTASPEQEERIRVWMERSPENERALFAERKLYDAAMLLSRPTIGDDETFGGEIPTPGNSVRPTAWITRCG